MPDQQPCTVLYFFGPLCDPNPMHLFPTINHFDPKTDQLLVVVYNRTNEEYTALKEICDLIQLQFIPCQCIEFSRDKGVVDILIELKDLQHNLLWITGGHPPQDIPQLFEWMYQERPVATSPKYEKEDSTCILHEDICLLTPTALSFVDQIDDQLTPFGAFTALSSLLQAQNQQIKNHPNLYYEHRCTKNPYLCQLTSNILYEWKTKLGLKNIDLPKWYNPQTKLISIVVPIYNNLKLTQICIDSILEFSFLNYEVILIDNGSQENISPWGEEIAQNHTHIQYIRNTQNQGFPQGCNQGISLAKGEYIILLNNDTMVTPSWLSRMISGSLCSNRIIIFFYISNSKDRIKSTYFFNEGATNREA